MTKLEEVMAEEWSFQSVPRTANEMGSYIKVAKATWVPNAVPERAAVAVLGKRALSLLLEHEWSAVGEVPDGEICPACDAADMGIGFCIGRGVEKPGPHHAYCEIGRIVAAAKEIG